MLGQLREVASVMLEDWSRTRGTVRQAAWLRDREFCGEA
jgi:hypothetical protein